MIGNLHKQFFELDKHQKAVFKLLGARAFPDRARLVRLRASCA